MSHSRIEEDPRPVYTTSSAALLQTLQTRAQALLSDLNAYRAHLKSQNKQQEVELRIFKRGIESEFKSLERITQTITAAKDGNSIDSNEEGDGDSPQLHALRSSNLPFYEAVWDVAKSSHAVVALGKYMHWNLKGTPGRSERVGDPSPSCNRLEQKPTRKRGVLVDVVAENGLEWIKVSTMTEKRLLFEMAKEGWELYADSSDDDSEDEITKSNEVAERRTVQLDLVRVAEELKAAAKGYRVQFQHPRIRFILPKIREGVFPDIDAFVADLRATGATVQCGLDWQHTPQKKSSPEFDQLMPGVASVPLTETLNVDCTILLALISDISHLTRSHLMAVENTSFGTLNPAILRQIEAETMSPLLPRDIYPLLVNRSLECTSHAAERMQDIAQCMGTASERNRADIVLGIGAYQGQAASLLREAWREHSTHAIPPGIQFPVKVVDFDALRLLSPTHGPAKQEGLHSEAFPSSLAARATSILRLSPINLSVFLFGWARQIVTLTSNRAVATGLLRTINELLDQDERNSPPAEDIMGPIIHICDTARSLVGKAKSSDTQATEEGLDGGN